MKFEISSQLRNLRTTKAELKESLSTTQHPLLIIADAKKKSALLKEFSPFLNPWQLEKLSELTAGKNVDVTLPQSRASIALIDLKKAKLSPHGPVESSLFHRTRDIAGALVKATNEESFDLLTYSLDSEAAQGALVGAALGTYRFHKPRKQKFRWLIAGTGKTLSPKTDLARAASLSEGINLARFLVDTPPGEKSPAPYSKATKKHFEKMPHTKVEIWNEARLKKEKMGMLLAVGQGGSTPPALVHIRYRHPKAKKSLRPIAFVGKGITFDTGGLNLKPGNAMRLMKKDMGGSAAVCGIAHFVISQKLPLACDFYLSMAENSVDAVSFRPGDILTSRSGKTVEIDNTDAEGRLALGDALDVAVTQKGAHAPCAVIDLATLTGAIKAGLGVHHSGLFSNNDKLASALMSSSQKGGDWAWRMPLTEELRPALKSHVADMVNCTSGWGGAITAALFLQEFVGEVPWAHLDIYGWSDSTKGAQAHPGANGQGVSAMASFLEDFAKGKVAW